MNTTLLAVWGSALVMNLACWGVGIALVTSDKASIRLLGGWCVFFLICTLTWIWGLSGDAARPLVWVFGLVGTFFCFWRREWSAMFTALICSGLVSLVFVAPYLLRPHLEAYGVYGTDMWGYVSTSEWVRHHSIHELPTPGSPMRYNWVWHVLDAQERPLTYTALACFGSAAGITPIQAYVAIPAALMASLSMLLCLTPRVFGLSRVVYVIPFALLVAVHPLVLLHWILQFFSGAVVSGCVCLSFAALLTAETGRARMEGVSLCLLMLVFCSALYIRQFLLVALILAGIPAVAELYGNWRTSSLRLRGGTPVSWLVWSGGALAALTAVSTLVFTQASASELPESAPVGHRAGEILTIFGGASPLPWFGYSGINPVEYIPELNLTGWLMAALTLGFLGYLALNRWRQSKDISIPVALLTAAGCTYLASNSHFSLSRVLPIFGPAILFGLAVLSSEISSRGAAFAAALLCSLPLLRSSGEVIKLLQEPDYTLFRTETEEPPDWDNWRVLGFLYLHEDKTGYDWRKHPSSYFAITHFLPDENRQRIAKRLGLPIATPPP